MSMPQPLDRLRPAPLQNSQPALRGRSVVLPLRTPVAPRFDRAAGGWPLLLRNFLRPSLLLLLAEQPGYGYDLLKRLSAGGLTADTGAVYRTLSAMEESGLVAAREQISQLGPARRQYRVTARGMRMLRSAEADAVEASLYLNKFLTGCRHVAPAQARRLPGAMGSRARV